MTHPARVFLTLGLLMGGAHLVAEEPPAPASERPGYGGLFQAQCAVCHGEQFEGTALGVALIGVDLTHGDTVTDIINSIANGFPGTGMPAWSATLSEMEIKNLALYISETRSGLNYADFNYDTEFTVPEEPIESEKHKFVLETVIAGLDPLPFSIAPLPDGRILLTEKKRGLSIISRDGEQSDLIEGTPRTFDDTFILSVKQEWGFGWMMEVALHPDYPENGWVYIYFGDRCSDCNAFSRNAGGKPVSMNKLVRGRIEDGRWIDEQAIWQADIEHYGLVPDIGAGGRLAFDGEGYVFLSVGVKGIDNHTGIQDLATPWGKIHRVHDDGRIPSDNPFIDVPGALPSIWTYGHRSPQGLEFRSQTEELWGTEHGPRGGDEINRLLPGHNYGWPLYSKGANYDGSPVAYGTQLGIEFDLEDIDQPVIDLTPSPAVSSFIFYEGSAFPGWQNDLIVGSLKARSLYRMTLEDNRLVHREALIENFTRFRDIETGPDGEIYVLLEHNSGGQVVRLVPVD